MGSPSIFSGNFTKLLTSRGILNSTGSINEFDGNKNYISNSSAEVDTTGWATYADAAGNIPVDGTGGTATNLTFSRSTSSPLRGLGSFLLSQANSTSLQGKGVSYDFTIDSADQNKVMTVSFDYNASSTFLPSNGVTAPLNDGTTSTTAGNSDIEVFIYDKTNATLIYVSPEYITAIGANNFLYTGNFQSSPSSTSYRLIFHVATTSANATGWTFKFDNVFCGIQPINIVAPMTDFSTALSVTTNGLGTSVSQNFYSRRTGDTLTMRGTFVTGTCTAATASLSMPSGYVLDSSKIANNIMEVGWYVAASGAAQSISSNPNLIGVLHYDGSDTGKLYFGARTQSGAIIKDNGNAIINDNTHVYFEFSVPIQGWATSAQSSNNSGTGVVALIASGTPANVTAGNPFIFPTTNLDSTNSYSTSTGQLTAPVSGYYCIQGYLAGTWAGTSIMAAYVAGAQYGGAIGNNLEYNFGGVVYATAGQTIDVRPVSVGVISISSNAALSIFRLQGISGTDATNLNTAGTVVKRDANGSFNGNVTPNITTVSNAAYTMVASDRIILQTGTMSASRTITLPAANALPAGARVDLIDSSGTVTTTNTLVWSRAGSDTLDGGTSITIPFAYGRAALVTDGSSKWTIVNATLANIQVFTGNSTWTKPAGYMWTRRVLIGGGAGGGSGDRDATATARTGGGGGAGGGQSDNTILTSLCAATETIVVGAAGTGGTAITADTTVGNAGTAGGTTSFGTAASVSFLSALGGGAGNGGANASSAAASVGGTGTSTGGFGAASSNTGGSGNPGGATFPGHSGGGASGGGITSANAQRAGGVGQASGATGIAGGTAGAAGGGTGGAGAGTGFTDPPTGGSGGGGGGSLVAGVGGAGGAGGLYGGGGGGGAASLNGNNSGAGGAGAAGIAVIYSW